MPPRIIPERAIEREGKKRNAHSTLFTGPFIFDPITRLFPLHVSYKTLILSIKERNYFFKATAFGELWCLCIFAVLGSVWRTFDYYSSLGLFSAPARSQINGKYDAKNTSFNEVFSGDYKLRFQRSVQYIFGCETCTQMRKIEAKNIHMWFVWIFVWHKVTGTLHSFSYSLLCGVITAGEFFARMFGLQLHVFLK